MGRNRKKWWFPPLENKKKPGPHGVVTIDGDEEDFDTVMASEVSANHELRDRIIAGLAKGVVNCFTDLVPDGNDRFKLEPSPELAAMYPGQTLEEIKASLEVKLEYGIDMEPVPPQVSEEQEEEDAMMEIQKPGKRVKRTMWGPGAVFNCETCQKSFNNWPSLRSHRYTHVNDPDKYECQACHKKFRNSVSLSQHRRTHVNDPGKHQCQVCEKKFRNSIALAIHRKTHVNEPDKHQCQVCEKKFRNAVRLAAHRLIHVSDAEKHKCQVCEKKFANAIALRAHRLITHVNEPDKYNCKLCDKKFSNPVARNNHRRQHVNEGATHECDEYKKVFKNSRGLANHRRTHKNGSDTRNKRTQKKKKDKNAPKRPTPAYISWLNANREALKEKHQDLSVKEFRKTSGEIWKSMEAKNKVEWEEKYKESMKEYKKLMKDYVPTKADDANEEREKSCEEVCCGEN